MMCIPENDAVARVASVLVGKAPGQRHFVDVSLVQGTDASFDAHSPVPVETAYCWLYHTYILKSLHRLPGASGKFFGYLLDGHQIFFWVDQRPKVPPFISYIVVNVTYSRTCKWNKGGEKHVAKRIHY